MKTYFEQKNKTSAARAVGRLGMVGEGPRDFSNVLIYTSLLVNRKPLGQREVAGDDSTARFGVPNPLYTGRGTVLAHANLAPLHDNAKWRNHYRWNQWQRQMFDTNILLTQQLRTNTPIALPNLIPTTIELNRREKCHRCYQRCYHQE